MPSKDKNLSLVKKSIAIFANKSNQWIQEKFSDEFTFITLPEIEPVKTEEFSKDLQIMSFDWILLNDMLTTEVFIEKLKSDSFDFFELDQVQICTAGESISTLLKLHQIHSDIISTNSDQEAVFKAIMDYNDNKLEGLKFLLIKEKNQDLHIAEFLKYSGAKVTKISLYELKIEDRRKIARLKALVKGGAIDAFIFTSPKEIPALEILFGENLSECLHQTQVLAIDEFTFQALLEKKLNPRYFDVMIFEK